MTKYNFEFKKKVVLEYINENISIRSLAKKYAIKSHNNIEIWVAKYKKYGDEGLYRSRKNEEYPFEKKIYVVELYLTSDALRERRKGRKILMAKSPKKLSKETTSQTTNDNISKEYVKKLEDQLLQLRIENAFLKEARRLRLAEEAEMKRRREL